jgi:sulfotransferase family protein
MIGAIRNILCKHYIDRNNDPGASVLLASSGRAGSTWVAHIINYRNEFRLMFEPFREDLVPECAAFRLNQYIRPSERPEALLRGADAVYSGRVRNDWVDAYNRRLFINRRLIKDIRVNLFLKWTRINFPTMPVVFLMRHPCAVARSRMALGWDMDLHYRYLSQPDLVEDLLAPFAAEMAQAATEWERQIFAWCVENYVPLAQCDANDVHLTFYESLVLDPEVELGKICAHIGIGLEKSVRRKLSVPSQTARTGKRGEGVSSVVAGGDVLDDWRSSVSAQEVKRAMEIVRMFGLDRIYGEETAPRPGAAAAAFAVASTQSSVMPATSKP